jgi:hypothetical protein
MSVTISCRNGSVKQAAFADAEVYLFSGMAPNSHPDATFKQISATKLHDRVRLAKTSPIVVS